MSFICDIQLLVNRIARLTIFPGTAPFAKCMSIISAILGVKSFVYILTPKMADRIGACKCAAHCAKGQYGIYRHS